MCTLTMIPTSGVVSCQGAHGVPPQLVRRAGYDLAEGVATCAGATCVGVVDGEPLFFDGVGEVHGCAVKVWHGHPVNDDIDTTEVG